MCCIYFDFTVPKYDASLIFPDEKVPEKKFSPKHSFAGNPSRSPHISDLHYDNIELDRRLSEIISLTFQYTLKNDTYVKLRADIRKLVGIDLLSKDNLVVRPELLEQTLYSVLGPSARLIFERATVSILKEFSNMTLPTGYGDWGDYSRLVSALRANLDPSTQYA